MKWAGKKWRELLCGWPAVYGGLFLGSLGLPFFATPFDLWFSRAVLPVKSSPWGTFLEFFTYTGHGLVLGGLCIALLLWGARQKKPRQLWCGKYGLVALLSGGFLVQLLKHLFGRARPWAAEAGTLLGPSLAGGLNSFPSGHSVSLFAVAGILGHAFPSWRPGFFTLAALATLSRVLVGAHFPSDIIAGIAVGLCVSSYLALLFPVPTSESS